ncbi:MAG TPA: hypothetical protein PKL61_17475, partial [Accumulibacter sp.]|uniref:hypothetical protein n=1 Tax=Accumulibacter sp. TaxID=2053492 RepID=UPI002C2A4CC2
MRVADRFVDAVFLRDRAGGYRSRRRRRIRFQGEPSLIVALALMDEHRIKVLLHTLGRRQTTLDASKNNLNNTSYLSLFRG